MCSIVVTEYRAKVMAATTIQLGEITAHVSFKSIENVTGYCHKCEARQNVEVCTCDNVRGIAAPKGTDFAEYIHLLSDNEMNIYKSFNLEKRKKEYLAGRIAAKEAVGHLTDSSDVHNSVPRIEILKRAGGAPFVTVGGHESHEILVSISHSNEVATAAACIGGIGGIVGLGIDVEAVEERGSSFSRTAFTKKERNRLERFTGKVRETFSTHLFTLKEAVTKALGTGLSVNTYDIEVLYEPENMSRKDGDEAAFLSSDEEEWRVLLHKKAKKQFEVLGGSHILVKSRNISKNLFVELDAMRLEKRYAMSLAAIV